MGAVGVGSGKALIQAMLGTLDGACWNVDSQGAEARRADQDEESGIALLTGSQIAKAFLHQITAGEFGEPHGLIVGWNRAVPTTRPLARRPPLGVAFPRSKRRPREAAMRIASGDWSFDSETRTVLRRGTVVSLSPKAFALLQQLIGSRPRAVSKPEIHEHLWPGTFVSPANLANLVAEIRAALGDDAREGRIIRTVPRFGYAFCAEAGPAAEAGTGREPASQCRLIWGEREVVLGPGENILGRDQEAVVWLDLDSVSRRHARIVVDPTGAVLEDLKSKNGTFLGERRIASSERLADGDRIGLGDARLVFRRFEAARTTKTQGRG
jgi:DNA-binding winged helix-turn-helix (wHTH) protein